MSSVRDLLSWYHPRNRRVVLTLATLVLVGLAVADWLVQSLSFGFLYLFPILLAAGFLSRTQIVGLAILCTCSVEYFAPALPLSQLTPRVLMTMMAFLGAGWFAHEVALRREAEEHLRVLVETSPAAILTLNEHGTVTMANQAARRLLGFDTQALVGMPLHAYLPMLAAVGSSGSGPQLRTVLEARGRRKNGEAFLAHIWFSTIPAPSGIRIAAIILDASEDLREREEVDLYRMMLQSRQLVGAVFHEIRNLCAAVSVVHANLGRDSSLAENKDYEALGTLVEGLRKLASAELRSPRERSAPRADLGTVLEDLRIILEPEVDQSGIDLLWDIPGTLPKVSADHHALLQAFLNLSQNSLRVLQDVQRKELKISVQPRNGKVEVRFADSGPGVAHPELLFRPFQEGADVTGLGLYVTRALLRGFAGELRYEGVPASATGACFTVELALSPAESSRS
jgi:PAS domain S-box-containing protein